MYWIGVGILIWIGLAIAPIVIGLIMLALPFVIGGGIGAVIGLAITQLVTGLVVGFLIGGLAPYFFLLRE